MGVTLPRLLALVIALTPLPRQARAAPSDWLLSDYVHTEWTHHNGLPLAPIKTITQTTDGYLWILTQASGLLRFDGMRFVPVPVPCDSRVGPPAAGADGVLWVTCHNRLLRRTARGEIVDVSRTFSWSLGEDPLLHVDRRGRVWVVSSGVTSHPIYVVGSDGTSFKEIYRDPNRGTVSLAEDSDGVIWITNQQSVFRIRGDRFEPVSRLGIRALTAAPSGGVFACSADAAAVWHLRADSQRIVGRTPRDVEFACFSGSMAAAGTATVWIGTRQHGIALIHEDGRTELLPDAQQMGYVQTVFIDREGTIWLGTMSGLHRFRARRARLLSTRARLMSQPEAVFVDSRDDLWIASAPRLLRVNERTGAVRVGGEVDLRALAEDKTGRLWLATPSDVGYLANDRFVPVRDEAGRPVLHVFSFQLDSEGTLWALSQGVGVYRVAPGVPRVVFPVAEAHADFVVSAASGVWLTIWNANRGGLMQLVPGRPPVFHTPPGISPPVRIWSLASDGNSVWVGGEGGLWRWRNGAWTRWGREHGLPNDADVTEIAPDRSHLWLMTSGGIAAVPRAQLDDTLDGAPRVLTFARIGELDGVIPFSAGPLQSPRVSVDRRGRHYFVTAGSVAIVEPSAVTELSFKPAIAIESVVADGHAIDAVTTAARFVEPSLVQFEYTSLSLRSPENIRFRYMMEGYDADWIEAGGQRLATYGALAPGTYRFRVIGTGSEGIWNEEGATFAFQIAPVFWHTWWFGATVVALGTVMLLGVHRLRLRRLTDRLNLRFEAQLAERTRIAQDLHDTLLQDACAALMQVELADVILTDAASTSPAIDPALPPLKKAVQVLSGLNTQGRATVHGLRELSASADLTEALMRTAREQSNQQNIAFRVNLAGSPRALGPQIRAELYWIAREALINAYQHGGARRIDVDLAYARACFRCVVRDDGRGIDVGLLQRGRDGHWGLTGMRERAQRVGAQLEIRSVADGGTEVEFSLDGRLAYVHAARMDRVRQWWTQWRS